MENPPGKPSDILALKLVIAGIVFVAFVVWVFSR
jgi:hypothetical protein